MKSVKSGKPYHPPIVDRLRNRLCRAGYSIIRSCYSSRFGLDFVARHVEKVLAKRSDGSKCALSYETVMVVGCVKNLNQRTLSAFYEAGIPPGVEHLQCHPRYTSQLIICVCIVSSTGAGVIKKLKSMRREFSNHSVSFMPLILRADSGRIVTCKLETDFFKGYCARPLQSALKLLTMAPAPRTHPSA